MKILLPALLALGLCCTNLSAQIAWLSSCDDRNVCLPAGNCTQANVLLSAEVVGGCTTPDITYKIDLHNNGNTDINGDGDTIQMVMPKGTHKITWRAVDFCANVSLCTYRVTVKDCSPPNMVCINGLTQGLDAPICEETFMASSFILNMSDNCTPNNQIQIGMRRSGDGTGFPTAQTLSFDECDLGFNQLEVWSKDASGLMSTCYTYVLIQYANSGCDCNPDADITIKGCARTPNGKKAVPYALKTILESTAGASTPIVKNATTNVTDSCFQKKESTLPFGVAWRLRATPTRKDDPLFNVSTYDLLLMSRHILNTDTFKTQYHVLAADVNDSKTITTFDIVETRKLILGIYDTFPIAPSWRFVQPLAKPNLLTNWSALKFNYDLTINTLNSDTTLQNLNFIAVKTGDVSYAASLAEEADDRNAPELPLSLDDEKLQPGEEKIVHFRLPENARLDGWQLALHLDPAAARLLEVLPGDAGNLPAENFSSDLDGNLRVLWFDPRSADFSSGDRLFSLKIKALRGGRLSEILKIDSDAIRAEAYPAGEKTPRVLVFNFSKNETAMGADVQFFAPRPNPFADATIFNFILKKAENVRLELFDPTGKLVFQQENIFEKGEQSMLLRSEVLPCNGLYFFKLRAGDACFSGKILNEK